MTGIYICLAFTTILLLAVIVVLVLDHSETMRKISHISSRTEICYNKLVHTEDQNYEILGKFGIDTPTRTKLNELEAELVRLTKWKQYAELLIRNLETGKDSSAVVIDGKVFVITEHDIHTSPGQPDEATIHALRAFQDIEDQNTDISTHTKLDALEAEVRKLGQVVYDYGK